MMYLLRPLTLVLAFLFLQVGVAEDPTDFSLQVSDRVPSLQLPADLDADVVLKHPLVANPLYMHFDARGRLWLVEYRQYPWPAGLRLLSRDAVWRNRYEPPFAPPPPHAADSPFRGRDRISIHEDTNGDGKFDQSKVFLDGLNFATSALPGRGGVFVMNPPYLLFYSDQNQDDVPDSETPRILLSGFGIEDSHSIANSLRWGPDGWIYATQGSTVSGAVVRHGEDNQPIPGEQPVYSLGQNLWRYHPEKHQYEIFAEGGGNAFGVEVDSQGRTYSGHNGGNTRGFHYIQGGYYQKTFGKHGDLSNPFSYGYFPQMRHHDVQRFTHTFSIYESNELPSRYHGHLFGVNPVEHYVMCSEVMPDGSSQQTTDIATVLEPGQGARADWFTPVDIQVGPDGAMYVADWYSIQANHYRNHEGETNPDLGRVIRIRAKSPGTPKTTNLESLDSHDLVARFLDHHNRWYRHQVLRILGGRKDATLRESLLGIIRRQEGQTALDALWALHLSAGISPELAREFLGHTNPHVRRWAIRLWGDFAPRQDLATAQRIATLATQESDAEVMSQIICTARRLDIRQGLPIISSVLMRDEFASDIHIPLSLWWAVENIADDHPSVLSLFQDPQAWDRRWKPAGSTLTANLIRRFVTQADQASLRACAQLMQIAPQPHREALYQAFAQAVEGRSLPVLPGELEAALANSRGVFSTLLSIRRGDRDAIHQVLDDFAKSRLSAADRIQVIRALGDTRALLEKTVPVLLKQLKQAENDSLRVATLVALQNFDAPSIGDEVTAMMADWSAAVQETAEATLASRAPWATCLLDALEQGLIKSIQPETVARLRLHPQEELRQRVEQRFPQHAQDDEARNNQIARLLQIIDQGQGQPLKGQELFFSKANCGKCHQLFSRGGEVGPDLTPYNRTKLRDILLAIIHPNAEIREGYENHTAVTSDGQIITGLKIESNDQLVVLRGVDGQDHVIAQDDIEEIAMATTSLMPAGLLDNLSDEELRDLFAYLVSTTPPK